MASSPKVLTVAVVLFPNALPLDFVGSTSIFHALHPRGRIAKSVPPPPYVIEVTHLGRAGGPLALAGGLQIQPNITFEDAIAEGKHFDVILMPGGNGARPGPDTKEAAEFLLYAVPKASWAMTVCTGSRLLASTGLLNGHRATTNKAAFTDVSTTTKANVEWVAHARWVVSKTDGADGPEFWTASGVSAGTDMACGWIEEVFGREIAQKAADYAEYTNNPAEHDPFAEKYGL